MTEFAGFQNAFLGNSVDEARKKRAKTNKPVSRPATPSKHRIESQSQLDVREESQAQEIEPDDGPGANDLPPLDDMPMQGPLESTAPAPAYGMVSPTKLDTAQVYLWAISELTASRASLIAFLLSHESDPHTRNESIPFTRYLTEVKKLGFDPSTGYKPSRHSCHYPPAPVENLHRSTLMRIMATKLPPGLHEVVHEYHTKALDMIMHSLVSEQFDAEERVRRYLDDLEEFEPANKEGYMSSLHDRIKDDGFFNFAKGISMPIRMLLGLFLRLCMVSGY